MRLVCPNCEAQYEVDDSAIPAVGRDVQCSACGHGWFHRPEPVAAAAPEAAGAGSAPLAEVASSAPSDPTGQADTAPPEPAPLRRPLDENVMAILREEALREAAVRRAEAARALETQPDLGLVTAATTRREIPKAQPQASVVMTSQPAPDNPWPSPVPAVAVADTGRNAPRRELLPDIEEINSSLSASSERRGVARGDAGQLQPENGRSGFRTGFLAMMTCCALLALAYAVAPRLAELIPGLAPALLAYVETVDSLRLSLSHLVDRASALLVGAG